MKLTQTTKYAIQSAVYLARCGGIVSSKEIAAKTGMPQNYLLRVLREGTKAGVFNVSQGVQGGFCLGRRPDRITLLDLYHINQGQVTFCSMDKDSADDVARAADCPVLQQVCEKLQRLVEDYLRSITVSDLVKTAEAYHGQGGVCQAMMVSSMLEKLVEKPLAQLKLSISTCELLTKA